MNDNESLEALPEDLQDNQRQEHFEMMRRGIRPQWQLHTAAPGKEPKNLFIFPPEQWIKSGLAFWAICLAACPLVWFVPIFAIGFVVELFNGNGMEAARSFFNGQYGPQYPRLLVLTLASSLLMSWLCRVVPTETVDEWYLENPQTWVGRCRRAFRRTFYLRQHSAIVLMYGGFAVFFWKGKDHIDSVWFMPCIWAWLSASAQAFFHHIDVGVKAAPPQKEPFGNSPSVETDELKAGGLL